MILSTKLGYETVTKACRWCDHVVSMIAPLFMAVLIGGSAVLVAAKPPEQMFVTTHQSLEVKAGTPFIFSIPIAVHVNAPKAVYRVWLTDASGSVVYHFPDQLVNDSNIDFRNAQLILPTNLKPGRYSVTADIVYPFTPLRNGSMLVKAGTIDVTM